MVLEGKRISINLESYGKADGYRAHWDMLRLNDTLDKLAKGN